jgi:hypothetical protein
MKEPMFSIEKDRMRVSVLWSLGSTERGLSSGAANPKARSQNTREDVRS